jgi:hypothetical protein
MKIYTVDQLAELLGFENHMYREHEGKSYIIYKKRIMFDGEAFCYTMTESPPNVGFKGTKYRLNLDYRETPNDTNINASNLKEFNELIRELKHFKMAFREEKINNILNSDED